MRPYTARATKRVAALRSALRLETSISVANPLRFASPRFARFTNATLAARRCHTARAVRHEAISSAIVRDGSSPATGLPTDFTQNQPQVFQSAISPRSNSAARGAHVSKPQPIEEELLEHQCSCELVSPSVPSKRRSASTSLRANGRQGTPRKGTIPFKYCSQNVRLFSVARHRASHRAPG
jgi:hypothetical protein